MSDIAKFTMQQNSTFTVTRIKLTTVVVLVVIACLYIVQASVPHNILTLPGQAHISPRLQATTPQGWAFFTKSPRSTDVFPFDVKEDGTVTALRSSQISSPKYMFGWNRLGRAQGVEQAILTNQVGPDMWTPCESGIADCLDSSKHFALVNTSPDPTICGHIAFAVEEPVPWAWRDSVADSWRITSVSTGIVHCV